jgi:hypothetical protein
VSALAEDLPAIAALDRNPVLILAQGAATVDMRVRVRAAAPAAPIGSRQGAVGRLNGSRGAPAPAVSSCRTTR